MKEGKFLTACKLEIKIIKWMVTHDNNYSFMKGAHLWSLAPNLYSILRKKIIIKYKASLHVQPKVCCFQSSTLDLFDIQYTVSTMDLTYCYGLPVWSYKSAFHLSGGNAFSHVQDK